LWLWIWFGARGVLLRKPLIMLLHRNGPLPGKPSGYAELLQRSTLVAAREFRSLQLLAEIGVRRRCC